MRFKAALITMFLIGATFLGLPLAWQSHSQARAQQQEPSSAKKTPTPTPLPLAEEPVETKKAKSLKLTPDEVSAGSALWNVLNGNQRDFTLAIADLRAAAKKPNDAAAHSLAVLRLNAVLENSDAAQAKWNDWVEKARQAHECADCELNLQTGEFTKPAAKP